MAILICRADGNLTTAATWGVCSAVAAAALDSEVSNTGTTTAYVESQPFTPGAVTIDGIAVKIRSRNASPSGTFSIRLAQAGATVAGTEVTVNVSDIITDVVDENGWFLVKFAGVLLVAATAYTVSVKSSVNAQVTLYRDATLGNWSRMVRTTTTGTPAAGDTMFTLGEWTAAATKSNRAVNMDSTVTLNYGASSTSVAAFGISNGGSVTWLTVAGTAYVLRLAGILTIWRGGIMNMGTTATPMPRLGSMRLEFNGAVDGDFGLKVYGTWSGQGLSRTVGKNVVRALLNVDAAAAATTLNVDTDTGWLNSDDIAIASTTRTTSQGETRTLNANAGASSMTISAGLTNAHAGTSPTQAEVILLSRSVRVTSVTAGIAPYVYFGANCTVDLDWVEFRYMGTGSSPKRGIEIDCQGGSVAMSYCSHRDFEQNGIYMTNAAWNNVAIDNHVAYHTTTTGAGPIRLGATTQSNWSVIDTCLIGSTGATIEGIACLSQRGTIARVRISGFGGSGINFTTRDVPCSSAWTDFDIHSCANGINFADGNLTDFGRLYTGNLWRNSGVGMNHASSGSPSQGLIENFNFFGNPDNVFYAQAPIGITYRGCTFAGDTTFAAARGLKLNQSNNYYRIRCENCTFGVVSGIKTAHTTGDIDFTGTPIWVELTLVSTNLASATEIANQANAVGISKIGYEKVDQVSGVNKTVYPALGTVSYETTVYRTASPSEKMTPSGAVAASKLRTSVKRARLTSGATLAIACYVRKDGTYTGSAPRLVMKANPAVGFLIDVVVATFSAAADTWQQLTGTTATPSENGVAEFYVDCDGSAGNVFVDDWTAV